MFVSTCSYSPLTGSGGFLGPASKLPSEWSQYAQQHAHVSAIDGGTQVVARTAKKIAVFPITTSAGSYGHYARGRHGAIRFSLGRTTTAARYRMARRWMALHWTALPEVNRYAFGLFYPGRQRRRSFLTCGKITRAAHASWQ